MGNAEATARGLKGAERKAFVKTGPSLKCVAKGKELPQEWQPGQPLNVVAWRNHRLRNPPRVRLVRSVSRAAKDSGGTLRSPNTPANGITQGQAARHSLKFGGP